MAQPRRRIALLMCGQMRLFDHPRVVGAFRDFVGALGCGSDGGTATIDLFVSTWSDRGVSYNHGHPLHAHTANNATITESDIRRVYEPTGVRIAGIKVRNYAEWRARLRPTYAAMEREGFVWNGMNIRGTMVPQLFTLWDANMMRCSAGGQTHDLVIRIRPDLLYNLTHAGPLLVTPVVPNTVTGINSPAAGVFWPQRIYDIFFWGTAAAMDNVCDAYNNVEAAVAHPFNNGLHPRDACRILYVQAALIGTLRVGEMAPVASIYRAN